MKLYCVYARHHLEYAVQSWSPWLIQDKEVLEKVQMRAIMMVSNMKGKTYEERLVEAKMRRFRRDKIQM